jgi:hypothetical protein
MPHWLSKALRRIRGLAAAHKVRFSLKAFRELSILGLGLEVEDACDVLAKLRSEDSAGRLLSKTTGEWMYVFKPLVEGAVVYVKVILRDDCLVVSFHEDEGDRHEEDR